LAVVTVEWDDVYQRVLAIGSLKVFTDHLHAGRRMMVVVQFFLVRPRFFFFPTRFHTT
jgi:hypothetical protein